jgi:hypothetical protein
MRQVILLLTVVLTTTGCASTLPPKYSIDMDFNTTGVKSLSVKMDCTNVKVDDIDPASVPDFCKRLQAAAKSSIGRKTGYEIREGSSDIDINIKLEEISASARFWVDMGAVSSVLTTCITIIKDGEVIAEKRIVETNTIPNITDNAWSNEEMINQYIGNMGGRIADFIAYPKDF